MLGCAKAAHRQTIPRACRVDAANRRTLLVTHRPLPRSRATASDLLLEALRVDSGEIETVAHLRGAQEMLPGVEFILDIGGQDMKCHCA